MWTGSGQSNGTISGQHRIWGRRNRSAIAGSLNNPRYATVQRGILAQLKPTTTPYYAPVAGLQGSDAGRESRHHRMVDRVDAGGGQHLPPGRDDRGRGRFQRSGGDRSARRSSISRSETIRATWRDRSASICAGRAPAGWCSATGWRPGSGTRRGSSSPTSRSSSGAAAIRAVSDNVPVVLTIPAWSALEPSQNVDGGLDQR